MNTYGIPDRQLAEMLRVSRNTVQGWRTDKRKCPDNFKKEIYRIGIEYNKTEEDNIISKEVLA